MTLSIGGHTHHLHDPNLPIPEAYRPILADWLSEEAYVTVHTSGSTGTPKPIQLEKSRMAAHARMTGDFFNLQPGDKALVCLPAAYIAGKMMLIRGIVLGLDLTFVEPDSRPLADVPLQDVAFAAMVPLQVEESLQYDRAAFERIQTVIIGGAPISHDLHQQLQHCTNRLYATYGMTETITHIAVQDIKDDDMFTPLPGVTLRQDERHCLVIEAPAIAEEPVTTNDVIELNGQRFRWLGRYDNVINSGGIKVHPEQVEKVLAPFIQQRFFIAGLPDERLGQVVTLVVEGKAVDLEALRLKVGLPKFHFPKQQKVVPRFEETETGKVQRQATLEGLG